MKFSQEITNLRNDIESVNPISKETRMLKDNLMKLTESLQKHFDKYDELEKLLSK